LSEVVELLIEIYPSHRLSAVCDLVLLAVVDKPVNWHRYLSEDTPKMIHCFTDFSSVIDDRPREHGDVVVTGQLLILPAVRSDNSGVANAVSVLQPAVSEVIVVLSPSARDCNSSQRSLARLFQISIKVIAVSSIDTTSQWNCQ